MKTNNKIRGNAFERRIAKLLSLKISDNERDNLFWRTPSSGAMGNKIIRGEGDIVCLDPNIKFDFIIECKTTRKGSIIPLRSSIKEYLRQCNKRYGDKKWLLILQICDKNDIYVICSKNTSEHISGDYICQIEQNYIVYDFYSVKFYDFMKYSENNLQNV